MSELIALLRRQADCHRSNAKAGACSPSVQALLALAEDTDKAADALEAKDAEIERLNKWADGFSDAQIKERATAEAYQRELRARVAELEAMLREARRDAERLDWLDRVNAGANERCGTKYGWCFDINHNRAALTDHNYPPLTVREAIDRAMSGAKP